MNLLKPAFLIGATLIAVQALAGQDERIPYFECVDQKDGESYRIMKSIGSYGAGDSFVYERANGTYYSSIAYLQNNRYTKSYVKEDEKSFEVYEKEDNSSSGLGPDGITLPAIAYRLSKFTLDKRTGQAEHIDKEVYMFLTINKQVRKFSNCFDLR